MKKIDHPHTETAGQHLASAVPTGRAGLSIGEALASLAGQRISTTDALYELDDAGRLQGVVPLGDLFSFPADRPLIEAMHRDPPSVHADADQEHVASLALRHRIAAVPVTDTDGVFLGVVPANALLEVVRREHVADLHRLAGIRREAAHARRALEEPPLRRVRDRLPWLTVGVMGSAVATFVMTRFASALESEVALAFFVPGIVPRRCDRHADGNRGSEGPLAESHAPARSPPG